MLKFSHILRLEHCFYVMNSQMTFLFASHAFKIHICSKAGFSLNFVYFKMRYLHQYAMLKLVVVIITNTI